MRIFSINRGVRGSRTLQERAIRFAYMIQDVAKERAKILTFWKKYGLAAAEEAYGVKRRTLYLWQRKLRASRGKLESLNCGSRAPKKKRQRRYNWRIVEEIKRLREMYPNLGEKKLYPLLGEFCTSLQLTCPKPVTIGRIIKDKGGLRLAPLKTNGKGKILSYKRRKVLRKPHDLKADHPGHVVALDTVERFVHGLRRYVITCKDIHSRFAFAWGTSSHASKAAEEFFERWIQVFPYPTTFVLTDNGSEFKKHFSERLLELQITHYHTYPKTPKMNAHVERFNRTIQESFIDYHDVLLLDTDAFNTKLMDWLLFYNTKRVHHAFKNKLSPVQYLLQYEQLPVECKSTCGHTDSCSCRGIVIKCDPHMATEKEENEIVTRVYEAGYHILPTVPEADVEKVVAQIRSEVEKLGGSFIAEGAPSLTKLAFPMDKQEGERHTEYDRGYFGWLKFEASTDSASKLMEVLKGNAQILRSMVFRTLREDTRAKFKAPQLREVKRTDTIKAAPRRAPEPEEKEAVSEVELEKALETLTAE